MVTTKSELDRTRISQNKTFNLTFFKGKQNRRRNLAWKRLSAYKKRKLLFFTSKLSNSDYNISSFCTSGNSACKIAQQAKSRFVNTKILACTSTKQLFSVTNTFLVKSKTSALLSSIPSALPPQRFSDFYVSKTSTTRNNLNSQTLPLPPVTHTVFDGSPLIAFHPVSESTVREVLNKTAFKTCELDPLPSSLLAELVDDLVPSFTSVINKSFLTGSFPSVFKSAVETGRFWKGPLLTPKF